MLKDALLTNKTILELAQQCVNNSRESVMGYINFGNLTISMQQMNQAYLCVRSAQTIYVQNCQYVIPFFDEFIHRFESMNEEFLSAIRINNGMEHSSREFSELEECFNDLRQVLK